ncbi:DUF3619 family protein [Pseudaquabacterium pictum]|uniref:DUF3619 domain-containing protein n=1 Tax=Pseudaquabacterium pictum TaxID=2315236 RepID=A0A480AS15_9BURK|nr:DUF3619 family protein [Rubrivivax pictus]GCL61548.1 hypothetical protein AQPW35_06290 [Rubrivivax pictus]
MNPLTTTPSPSLGHPPRLEGLEGQFALRLTAHLNGGAQALPHDITERLRFSRERALASRRAVAVLATAPVVVASGSGRAAALGSPPSLWLRLVSALPLVVLVAGLVFIQHHHDLQQIEVAAEIDSALLADDLPPAAYGDPGFSEFLRSGEAP